MRQEGLTQNLYFQ